MKSTYKRPRRQRRGDRLINPDAHAAQIVCDGYTAPLYGAERAADLKWGVDRLVELVSPETSGRYHSALAKLDAAIAADDPAETKRRTEVCIRGLAVMDAEAEANGAPRARPDVLEAKVGDIHFGILFDAAFWPAAREARPELLLLNLREIGLMLQTLRMDHPMIGAAKALGGAEIVAIRERMEILIPEGDREDEIPF